MHHCSSPHMTMSTSHNWHHRALQCRQHAMHGYSYRILIVILLVSSTECPLCSLPCASVSGQRFISLNNCTMGTALHCISSYHIISPPTTSLHFTAALQVHIYHHITKNNCTVEVTSTPPSPHHHTLQLTSSPCHPRAPLES